MAPLSAPSSVLPPLYLQPTIRQRNLFHHTHRPSSSSTKSSKPNLSPSSSNSPSKPNSPPAATARPLPSLKSLNAFAVSQASAGGRRHVPPKLPVDTLSLEYRAKARRITLAIVAAPVAIVTSYYLAMRIWGGVERKKLPGRGDEG